MLLAGLVLQAAFTPMSLRDSSGKLIKGTNVWKSGAIFGKSANGFKHGINNAVRGQFAFAAMGAVASAAMAPKGKAMAAVSLSLSESAGGMIGGVLGATLGGGIGLLAGTYLGGELGKRVGNSVVGRGVQAIHDFGDSTGRMNFGAGYQDSETAWTMRQTAVAAMSTSSLNARRFLGSEAAFMHT